MVGTERIAYLAATSGASSMSIRTTVTSFWRCSAKDSSAGAIAWHGPHHEAEKSTRTGSRAEASVASKAGPRVSMTADMCVSLCNGGQWQADDQCEVSTGSVIERNTVRVTLPSSNSRMRWWP